MVITKATAAGHTETRPSAEVTILGEVTVAVPTLGRIVKIVEIVRGQEKELDGGTRATVEVVLAVDGIVRDRDRESDNEGANEPGLRTRPKVAKKGPS